MEICALAWCIIIICQTADGALPPRAGACAQGVGAAETARPPTSVRSAPQRRREEGKGGGGGGSAQIDHVHRPSFWMPRQQRPAYG